MLVKRILVVVILAPVLIAFAIVGGWAYNLLIAAALGIAAWEFWRIFHRGGFAPSKYILIAGTFLLAVSQAGFGQHGGCFTLGLVVLAAMAWHVVAYDRGQPQSAVDFALTTGGVVYLGWLGSYLILLRQIPAGMWWLLLSLASIWLADSGAFSIGRRWGRHKMTRRVSPKKSWEGYLGGVLIGTLGTAALAALCHLYVPEITVLRGLGLGLAISCLAPIGDLGESMIKRQFGVKDSSNILPGHGGMMDRIDSWLWSGFIAYYFILWVC